MADSNLWVITTFFNPMGWSSRFANYKEFRRRLDANLLTVEWSATGDFVIDDSDAELIIKVSGGDLMWQKERLLNVGLYHLPCDCDVVAWIDCDVIFDDPNWPDAACARLADHEIVQLFADVRYLGKHSVDVHDLDSCVTNVRPSFMFQYEATEPSSHYVSCHIAAQADRFRGEIRQNVVEYGNPANAAPGLAWAARLAWIRDHGFFPDRAVIGGGDMHMLYGWLGCYDRYINALKQVNYRGIWSSKMRTWADDLREQLPRLSSLNGSIYHLHHGELVNRRYVDRHIDLAAIHFDPDHHLMFSTGGAWAFHAGAPSAVRPLMRQYFLSRQED